MANLNPPQGTRDFGADIVNKRNYIFDTIKKVFKQFGFSPLETPAMENLETLTGKYGEEGDKLIFKILNNGLNDDKNKDKAKLGFEQVLNGKNDARLTERALKYDLTIPFTRYVAANHSQLAMPFKRYQIQPVWRADRPQKGRYREFYQCDADVAGSNSLWNEVECIMMYFTVLQQLGLNNFEIKINHRQLLMALANICGGTSKMIEITIAIDKLDKIGWEGVAKNLTEIGLTNEQILIVENVIQLTGSTSEILQKINQIFPNDKDAQKAVSDFEFIFKQCEKYIPVQYLKIDASLARGLNYYTGCIFEVKVLDVNIGSIGGGGRYNDLTATFGVPNIPGVGISFGVDRIYDVMDELKIFPESINESSKILFFNLGDKESELCYEMIQNLRKENISAELYHEQAKFDKQFKYAEKKQIPFIAILGEKEMELNVVNIKNLETGIQSTISLSDLTNFIKNI